MRKIVFICTIVIPAILFVLTGCTTDSNGILLPIAKKGEIDLSSWDFKTKGPLQLNGEWEFYWNELLSPEDFLLSPREKPTGYIVLPGYWNKQNISKTGQFPPFGFGTLKLTIVHQPIRDQLGILPHEINTAFRMYINDALTLETGTVSTEKSTYIPNIIPKNASFHTRGNKTTIIIQISNFMDTIGGSNYILMGLDSQIFGIKNQNIASDLLLFGSFFIMGLYHLGIFLLRRKDKSPLFFGLFCLFWAFRTALMGERFFHQFFSFIGYNYLITLEIIAVPLAAAVFTLYFYSIFPMQFFKYLNYGFAGLSVLFALVGFFLPIDLLTNILPFYLILLCIGGLLISSILVWALLQRKDNALLFSFGFVILFISIINDVLYFAKVIQTGWIFPVGLFLFILIQSFLLSKKFTRAFSAVEKLSTQLSSMDKLKDAFLVNTSHELKNPLLGMMGLAETLLEGNAGSITEAQARNLSLITASGRRLLHLVNDLLDFSRFKKKEMVLEKKPVDLKEICDVVFVFSKPFLSTKKIVLSNKIPPDFPLVAGDEGRLQQIMHNLVGNAIKFTHSGEITVTARKEGNFAFFSVRDTGIGIPGDKLESIFESFEQVGVVDSTTGTGIGLSITKQLVELHGGKITVSSSMGEGSVFTFSIPISRSQKRMEEIELQPSHLTEIPELEYVSSADDISEINEEISSITKRKILLVDDDPAFHQIMEDYLDPAHFKLFHSTDGPDALQKIAVEDFDLLLLDVMMPGMSGYLVCKEVRKTHDPEDLPIIFITSKNLVSDIIAGLKAGGNDYLTKPVRQSELLARIKTHIQLSKMNKAYKRFIPSGFLRLLGRESIIDVELGDQVQREMTILFSDIRGFMTLSERMSPKENFNFLNSYFEKITPVIRKHHGYVDKYIGDGLMALFPGHPEDALRAALEMKRAVQIYNSFRTKVGYEPISIGIGLHTGPIMLGTIGDETRMEGTVISDTVNVASRLEGLTKPYGGSIIISSSIFLSLDDPSVYFYRFLGLVQVKGKREAVPIYEVFDNSDTDQKKLKTKDTFEKAIQAYFSRDFTLSEKYLAQVCEFDPYDKASRLFLSRAKEYQTIELPVHWDGVEKIEFK
ncbi:MAG: response regulator [Spirochaetales bacterium]|nr:response regulator [Spirochaetales bacterium]